MRVRVVDRFRIVVLAGLTACAARIPPLPPTPPVAAAAGLSIVLVWSAPVDLDLYVTDPDAETTYFGNRESRAGARLVRDFRCADVPSASGPREDVVVAEPRPGRYRVGVDFIDACGSRHTRVPFRVVVARNDARHETIGEVSLEAFEAVVLEMELERNDLVVTSPIRKESL